MRGDVSPRGEVTRGEVGEVVRGDVSPRGEVGVAVLGALLRLRGDKARAARTEEEVGAGVAVESTPRFSDEEDTSFWLVLLVVVVVCAAVRDDTALAFSSSRRFLSASRSCASFSASSLRFSYSVNKSNRSIAILIC